MAFIDRSGLVKFSGRLVLSTRGLEFRCLCNQKSWLRVNSQSLPVHFWPVLKRIAPVLRFDAGLLGGVVCRQGIFELWGEHVAQALNLSAYAAQLILNVLVAAIHVVDAIDDGLTVGDQGGQHQ